MVHPGQHAEQMKSEYSAEPAPIFVSGHASLKRRFQPSAASEGQAGFWRFQPEIARHVRKPSYKIVLITVNETA
ncbi:hypothetical protein EGO56_21370 (plasmid) [Pantoea vagans]|nr:hypothetical protein EGO56_21370 [Pantoea vagans]